MVNFPKDFAPWRDEYYFSGAIPRLHDERGLNGQSRWARETVKALSNTPDGERLATALASCRPGHRCGNGACKVCGWAVGRAFRVAIKQLAASCQSLAFVTVQRGCDDAFPTRLINADATDERRALTAVLRGAGFGATPVIGALDISLDVWPDHRAWALHWALLIPDRDPATIYRALTQVLAPHPRVQRPVWVRKVSGTPDRLFSYLIKNRFERKMLPRATRAKVFIEPTDSEFAELAEFLNRTGLVDRFFLQHVTWTDETSVGQSL